MNGRNERDGESTVNTETRSLLWMSSWKVSACLAVSRASSPRPLWDFGGSCLEGLFKILLRLQIPDSSSLLFSLLTDQWAQKSPFTSPRHLLGVSKGLQHPVQVMLRTSMQQVLMWQLPNLTLRQLAPRLHWDACYMTLKLESLHWCQDITLELFQHKQGPDLVYSEYSLWMSDLLSKSDFPASAKVVAWLWIRLWLCVCFLLPTSSANLHKSKTCLLKTFWCKSYSAFIFTSIHSSFCTLLKVSTRNTQAEIPSRWHFNWLCKT